MIEKLIHIGYSQQEAEVYVGLLRSGGAYVATLAQSLGVGRVGLYHTLDKLVECGLAEIDTTKKQKFYIPAAPERVLNIQKEHTNIATELVQQLRMIQSDHVQKPSFEYLVRQDDIESLLVEVFTSQVGVTTNICAYVQLHEWINSPLHQPLTQNLKKILSQSSRIQFIYPYDEVVKGYLDGLGKGKQNKLAQVSINAHEFPFQYDVFINDEIVGIFFFDNGEPRAIRLASKAYAESQQAIFGLAWLGATSFVV